MKLDRALQRQILESLAPHYSKIPQDVVTDEMDQDEIDKVTANMLYLESHGLIDAGMNQCIDGSWAHGGASITHNGMDFLADDGGLSAILGTVTIRLHDETIRLLIEARIQDSELPAEEKTGLMHQLRELRGESIKHLTMKLLDAGAESLPALLRAIQTSV